VLQLEDPGPTVSRGYGTQAELGPGRSVFATYIYCPGLGLLTEHAQAVCAVVLSISVTQVALQ
jgi:hypothetical protein